MCVSALRDVLTFILRFPQARLASHLYRSISSSPCVCFTVYSVVHVHLFIPGEINRISSLHYSSGTISCSPKNYGGVSWLSSVGPLPPFIKSFAKCVVPSRLNRVDTALGFGLREIINWVSTTWFWLGGNCSYSLANDSYHTIPLKWSSHWLPLLLLLFYFFFCP